MDNKLIKHLIKTVRYQSSVSEYSVKLNTKHDKVKKITPRVENFSSCIALSFDWLFSNGNFGKVMMMHILENLVPCKGSFGNKKDSKTDKHT